MSTSWRDIADTGMPAYVRTPGTGHGREGHQDGRLLPVLDSAPFRLLVEEAGACVAEKFLADYLGLLPARTAAVVDGLTAGDRQKTLDALVSLAVSSAMAGASRVEDHARRLQRQVLSGHWPDATSAKAILSQAIFEPAGGAVSPGSAAKET